MTTEQQGAISGAYDETLRALRVTGGSALAERYLAPAGAHETMPRRALANTTLPGATGVVSLTALALPKGFTVSTLTMWSATTAAVNPTNWWFALCNSAYVKLRGTADQLTAAWANGGGGKKALALSSPFTTAYEGLHYFAVMMKADTLITTLALSEGAAGAAYTELPYLSLTGLTGQTTPPADGTNLAPSPTATIVPFYAVVS